MSEKPTSCTDAGGDDGHHKPLPAPSAAPKKASNSMRIKIGLTINIARDKTPDNTTAVEPPTIIDGNYATTERQPEDNTLGFQPRDVEA
jgi:hypothetical protein